MVVNFSLNALSRQHSAWVERMGWHNKTVLEGLALIASEIGEAQAECIGTLNLKQFGEELADIALRILDMAATENVDLDAEIRAISLTWRSNRLTERVGEVLIEYANWTNTARNPILGAEFHRGMATVLARVLSVADFGCIDLQRELHRKIEINERRGTRGRII